MTDFRAFNATLHQKISTTLGGLSLNIVDVRGERRHDPSGLYLLCRIDTQNPAAIISKQQQLDRLPPLLPRHVTHDSTAGGVAFLYHVDGVRHTKPFAHLLADSSVSMSRLEQIITDITGKLRAWNPVDDFRHDQRSREHKLGYAWMREFSPLTDALDVPESLVIGNRTFRNPAAWAITPHLWGDGFPVLMWLGNSHGQLDVEHVYQAAEPFVVDPRWYNDNAPVLLDWMTLELSLLTTFMTVDTDLDLNEWIWMCQHISSGIEPVGPPRGRMAPGAAGLLTPLRQSLGAYVTEMKAAGIGYDEFLELSVWLSAAIAGLRVLSAPNSSEITRKAALIYAAHAFDRVATDLRLPAPQGEPKLIARDTKLFRIGTQKPTDGVKQFVNGYGLVIGVGNTQDPTLSLPVTSSDAHAIANMLKATCGYINENVPLPLTDKYATQAGIEAAFKQLQAQVSNDPEAIVVIYYSGHGYENTADGTYYLIPHETDRSNIAATALPMSTFDRWVQETRAKGVIVLLDCCHAGGANMTKNLSGEFAAKAPGTDVITARGGRVLIVSSTSSQLSYILGGHKNSLFTEVLIESVQHAGCNASIASVFETLRDEVNRRAINAGFEQSPRFNAANYDRVALCRGASSLDH